MPPSPAQLRHSQGRSTPDLPHSFSVSTLLQETQKKLPLESGAAVGHTVVLSRGLGGLA